MTAVTMTCLPWAGAGAGVYRSWQRGDTPRLRAVPVQVPGREEEFNSPFYTSMAEAATATAERIQRAADGPGYVVFGHSFGAVLAFEAVRSLLGLGAALPTLLIVSGSASPRRRRPPLVPAGDDELVAHLARTTGEVNESLAHPQLRPLLLPALRADLGLLRDYSGPAAPAVPVPVVAMRGAADPMVTGVELADWSAFTTGGFRSREFPGGHMYVTNAWARLWETIEELL